VPRLDTFTSETDMLFDETAERIALSIARDLAAMAGDHATLSI
jgi:hypothetical protein